MAIPDHNGGWGSGSGDVGEGGGGVLLWTRGMWEGEDVADLGWPTYFCLLHTRLSTADRLERGRVTSLERFPCQAPGGERLVRLVARASASRAADPGLISTYGGDVWLGRILPVT